MSPRPHLAPCECDECLAYLKEEDRVDEPAIREPQNGAAGMSEPPENCRANAVWRHKQYSGDRARISHVYFHDRMGWRVVTKGGTEFATVPGARRVPMALPLDAWLEFWTYDHD